MNAPVDVAGGPPAVDLTDAGSFGYLTTENLRFQDVDANGHVNNVAFMAFIENARVLYIKERMRFIEEAGLSVVAAHLELDLRRQMFYPGNIRAGARLMEIRRSSFVVGQAIFDQSGACAATGHAVVVVIDPASGRSRPIPEDIRVRLVAAARSRDGLFG